MPGVRRKVKPIRATSRRLRAAAAIARASSRVSLSGFSHSTCLPAASRPSTTSRCSELAITTLTTSMSSASAMACQEVSLRSYPNRRAASEPNSAFTSPMETSRTGGSTGLYSADAVRYAAACARPAMPAPITATPKLRP